MTGTAPTDAPPMTDQQLTDEKGAIPALPETPLLTFLAAALDHGHIGGSRSLGTIDDLKGNPVAVVERTETV